MCEGICLITLKLIVQAVSFILPPQVKQTDVGCIGYVTEISNAVDADFVQRLLSRRVNTGKGTQKNTVSSPPVLSVTGYQVTLR